MSQHLKVLGLNEAVPDEGEIGSKAQQPLHGSADQGGRHVEAGVPAFWNVHDPLMLRTHGDKRLHLGTGVLTPLGYCPHELPTCPSTLLETAAMQE